jgi:hypothetical protein
MVATPGTSERNALYSMLSEEHQQINKRSSKEPIEAVVDLPLQQLSIVRSLKC